MAFADHVYLVDDDYASAMSMKAVLNAKGFTVQIFDSAEAFLGALDDIRFDSCLVLDLRLPGMSGLELQKKLAERGAMLPTVMISGHADHASVALALENGAAAFLQKPFSGSDLIAAIIDATKKE